MGTSTTVIIFRENKPQPLLDMVRARIREMRLQKKLALKQVESATGINIKRFEQGHSDIMILTLYKLLRYYGFTPQELFESVQLKLQNLLPEDV